MNFLNISVIKLLILLTIITKVKLDENIQCKVEYGSYKYAGKCASVNNCNGNAIKGYCSQANIPDLACCINDKPIGIPNKLILKSLTNQPRNVSIDPLDLVCYFILYLFFEICASTCFN